LLLFFVSSIYQDQRGEEQGDCKQEVGQDSNHPLLQLGLVCLARVWSHGTSWHFAGTWGSQKEPTTHTKSPRQRLAQDCSTGPSTSALSKAGGRQQEESRWVMGPREAAAGPGCSITAQGWRLWTQLCSPGSANPPVQQPGAAGRRMAAERVRSSLPGCEMKLDFGQWKGCYL